MDTRKKHVKIAAALAPLLVAVGLCLFGGGSEAAVAAEGDEALFLPASYEQYLPLEVPTDAAVSERYIAVSDGDILYLYDKTEGEYGYIRHGRSISKLGFTPDGRLFFSDQDAHLFAYDFASGEARIQSDIPCATFVIADDLLYTTAVANGRTTFYAISHRNSELTYNQLTQVGELSTATSIAPHMFVKDGVLYCAINSSVHAYAYEGGTYTHTEMLLAGGTSVQYLTSVAVLGEEIYYTVNGSAPTDGLYRTTLNEGSTVMLGGGGFNALTSFGDRLYCVKGATVREIEVSKEGGLAYTGYELAADSDSVGRLAEAADTVRARGLIVVADRGNGRTTVYDSETGQYSALASGAPDCVATDGGTVAVAVPDGNGSKIALYRRGETDPYYTQTTANAVLGLAVVYGRCYFVTAHHYGVAEEGAQQEFTRPNSPVAMTSDVYGNLYVADRQYAVTKYTEDEFCDFLAEGESVGDWRLPADFRSLRADFDGNLYYLSDGALWCNGARFGSLPDTTRHVFYGADGKESAPLSFAMGFEDGAIYFQYGDFMLRAEYGFPTLGTIAADGVHGEVYASPADKVPAFTDVKAGATGIAVDLSLLNGYSEYFAYTSYARTGEGGRGVLLAEKGKFSLVALFEKSFFGEHDSDYEYIYTLALFRTEDCAAADVTRTELEPQTRYLSSEVAYSYYPCHTDALTIERLPRSTELTLLGTVDFGDGEGFDYAYVRHGNSYGYVPLAYLTEVAPLPGETYSLGYLKASEEGVSFRSEDGTRIVVKERTLVRISESGDGLYLVRFTEDGVEYVAQVTRNMIETGNSAAIRTSVIIILCVVAVGILAAYALLVPHGKKK